MMEVQRNRDQKQELQILCQDQLLAQMLKNMTPFNTNTDNLQTKFLITSKSRTEHPNMNV